MAEEQVTQEELEDEVEPEYEVEAENPEEGKPATPITNELKIVVVIKAGRILLAVQAPNCDPVYETMSGGLVDAIARLPELVVVARQKWATAPKYPKANVPEPSAPAPSRTTVTTTTTKAAKPKEQPSMF